MADETNTGKSELTPPSRRDVVTTAAQVAVTAPAVAVLLSATSKSAFAIITPYEIPVTDSTGGGGEEDADVVKATSGGVNQDDHV